MKPLERNQYMNLFFLSRSSCQAGIAGGSPAYTTISISSRPVFGPAKNSRSFNQSRPRPAVRTELPTFDSSTRINNRPCREPSESFFRIQIQINYVRARLASTRFSAAPFSWKRNADDEMKPGQERVVDASDFGVLVVIKNHGRSSGEMRNNSQSHFRRKGSSR